MRARASVWARAMRALFPVALKANPTSVFKNLFKAKPKITTNMKIGNMRQNAPNGTFRGKQKVSNMVDSPSKGILIAPLITALDLPINCLKEILGNCESENPALI